MGPAGDAGPASFTVVTHRVGASSSGALQIPHAESSKARERGREGRRLTVKANHFPVSIKSGSVVRYDVDVTTPWRRENRKSDSDLFHRGFRLMMTTVPALKQHR